MPVIPSAVNTRSEMFAANRKAMLDALSLVEEAASLAMDGGGAKAKARSAASAKSTGAGVGAPSPSSDCRSTGCCRFLIFMARRKRPSTPAGGRANTRAPHHCAQDRRITGERPRGKALIGGESCGR